MKKAILFLDHDGVICLSDNWGGRFKKKGFDTVLSWDEMVKI